MSILNASVIEAHLKTLIDPWSGIDFVSAKHIKKITLNERQIHLQLSLGYPAKTQHTILHDLVKNHLQTLVDSIDIQIDIETKIVSHAVQQNLKPHSQIKNMIAVASGKGGVGKSTTTVNLALALIDEGAKVGILDADIYGPSIPTLLGLSGLPETHDGKIMQPKIAYSLQTISMGYLVNSEQAMIWRGPMVTNALQQLLRDTEWAELDYLFIDLPPGTGDIQLTLAQQIPVSGAVIVTTPQEIALLDAQRGLAMFQKVNVPVLGLIENMSTHICSHCGHEEAIFGNGGGESMAIKNQIDLLGSLPLNASIRHASDLGKPIIIAEPNSHSAAIYRQIALKIAAKLALRPKDFSHKFAKIMVENS
jgi:ATP-binding protein involved in chromosome partitioning